MLERIPVNVNRVGKPSQGLLTVTDTKRLILQRSPVNENSVGKPSLVTFWNIKIPILERSPVNKENVKCFHYWRSLFNLKIVLLEKSTLNAKKTWQIIWYSVTFRYMKGLIEKLSVEKVKYIHMENHWVFSALLKAFHSARKQTPECIMFHFLSVHGSTHNGEMACECEECGKASSFPNSFERHKKDPQR